MRIHVLAFARLRELIGAPARELEVPEGSTAADLWENLARDHAAIAAFRDSTRIARNGRIVGGLEPLGDGDEIALLPPVGGG
jgi:molybdopterin converting factor subunit 1